MQNPRPDFRNIPRGVDWLRRMIEASERMDAGDSAAMDEAVRAMVPRGREPGDDDD